MKEAPGLLVKPTGGIAIPGCDVSGLHILPIRIGWMPMLEEQALRVNGNAGVLVQVLMRGERLRQEQVTPEPAFGHISRA